MNVVQCEILMGVQQPRIQIEFFVERSVPRRMLLEMGLTVIFATPSQRTPLHFVCDLRLGEDKFNDEIIDLEKDISGQYSIQAGTGIIFSSYTF